MSQRKQTEKTDGVDLIFCSPKSVSLACVISGDQRLESAHRQVVEKMMSYLEEHCKDADSR